MIIAVPVSEGRFCSHFGGAENFALYTVDSTDQTISGSELEVPPEHGRGVSQCGYATGV